MKIKGAKIIVECLIEQGVEYVFGYPGGAVLDIFDELYKAKDSLAQILTCHEQGACHAADGYARVSGKTGVVLATSGPGATNLVTGIANAYMDSVPLVAITGNVSVPLLGRDSFQEVDIAGITMPITKHNYIVKDIAELAATIREAFVIASSGRPGPVLIDIPKNIQQELYEFKAAKPVAAKQAAVEFDAAQIEAAAHMLQNSERPLLFAGGGVISANASDKLIQFIQSFDIPVVSSMMGLGAVSHEHPLFLGMIGMHGHAGANKALIECDTLIAVGTRFSDRVATNRSRFGADKNVIHIDIDFAEIDKNVPSSVYLCGDAAAALTRLGGAMKPVKRAAWVKQCQKHVADFPFKSTGGALCARSIIGAVRKLSPDTQVVATDVGQHQMWTAQSFGFKKPRTFITSGGLGTMGYGMGAAIGAAFANKSRVVLFTGDGSFHMNFNEVVTAVKHGLPIAVFILNNNALGMVRQWQNMFYEKRFSSTTLNLPTDYSLLAKAFGAESLVLEKNADIEKVVAQALACKGPILVDCRVCHDAVVLPMVPAGKNIEDIIINK
ncbi:MAG: biosynthetic-type acetolactate synthase large subunit [Firmicutes bacterium]|nr:biosynthetic-type acetolactate synthase large subunit [Bacillota bacterium]